MLVSVSVSVYLELITISNPRSERVNENITTLSTFHNSNKKFLCTCVYMQNFMFVCVLEEEHGKTENYHITSIIPVLQDVADFFLNIISFQHVLHFGVGRSQIEWNMKVKIEISFCTGLMLNDHSNPYNYK